MNVKYKGFTLIELLAVIIILGILMLIAIPSVTSYINNSRKETYVSTINELIKGAVVLVNSGEIEVNDPNTTYYIPTSAINLESGEARSPYGKFNPAYIAVTYDGDNYDYYFVGKDDKDMGISEITKSDIINKDSIEEVKSNIDTTIGINGKDNVVVFDDDLNPGPSTAATDYVSGRGNITICKRATSLHTELCDRPQVSIYSCYGAGYYPEGSKGTATVTYGNTTTTEGELNTGDAFDCDVNGDGIFDSATERFYYVSDYYDTTFNKFRDNIAVLIYYVNTTDGSTIRYNIRYDDSLVNWHGPASSIKYLPTTSMWPNVSLYRKTRRILTETGSTSTTGGSLPSNFSYEGYAARYLTYQEVDNGCNDASSQFSFDDHCLFLMENSSFTIIRGDANTPLTNGFWTENPVSTKNNAVYGTYSTVRSLTIQYITDTYYPGVRPAIEVPKNNIEY